MKHGCTNLRLSKKDKIWHFSQLYRTRELSTNTITATQMNRWIISSILHCFVQFRLCICLEDSAIYDISCVRSALKPRCGKLLLSHFRLCADYCIAVLQGSELEVQCIASDYERTFILTLASFSYISHLVEIMNIVPLKWIQSVLETVRIYVYTLIRCIQRYRDWLTAK